MGAWSASVTGNDTAQDLRMEYTAAFYYYDVSEAVKKIDEYVRAEGFDESDPEEWCDYFYSLADFMWKKGILTEDIKKKALEMIDSEFGLELWAEEDPQMLKSRKKVLEKFKQQLLSPLPSKKKIKPKAYTQDYFEVGDIIAFQLQTAGKPYTKMDEKPMSEEKFHSYDGKYILVQKVNSHVSWKSAIAPEVKDYWLLFRLFDGIYDEIPTNVDVNKLKDASICGHKGWLQIPFVTSVFLCENTLFYLRKRRYQLIGNQKDGIEKYKDLPYEDIFLGTNCARVNADSELLAVLGK